MNHPRRRFLWPAAPLFGAAVLLTPTIVGCENRKPQTVTAATTTAAPTEDAQALALATLTEKPDATHCREALQQLDALDLNAARPTLSAAEAGELTALLRLTSQEAADITQPNFSPADAAYVEECLLVRAGVKSLRLDGLPALDQARQTFDWVCRMVYVDTQWEWPSHPWATLQSGSGLAISRAYLVLAAWQQAGLDGFLVGPGNLKDTPSVDVQPEVPGLPAKYAPVRACGVKIDKDVYLFDPAAGRAIAGPDGTGVLTLAQAKAQPAAAKASGPAEETATWQPFLAPSLSSLSRRMEWLQKLNPGGTGVRLFQDVLGRRARFAADLPGVPCDLWNVPGDGLSATRALGRYVLEESRGRDVVTLRDAQRLKTVPFKKYLPETVLNGLAYRMISLTFAQPFLALRYTLDSPRDMLVRGQYQQASSRLEDSKRLADNAPAPIHTDPSQKEAFSHWAESFLQLSAALGRAEREGPAAGQAAFKDLTAFRSQSANWEIERAYVFSYAGRPLAAEVTFLMAQCVHERAERAERDDPARAAAQWKNAEGWWVRALDASAQARSPYPAREPHARALLARCRQFTAGK